MTTKGDVDLAELNVIRFTLSHKQYIRRNLVGLFGAFLVGLFSVQVVLGYTFQTTWCPLWLSLPLAVLGYVIIIRFIVRNARSIRASRHYVRTVRAYWEERGLPFEED